ncbi:sulfatase-like hydrolase/transferase [Natrinema salifodinae]|uniref:Sulfatase n=1 Tax=Natrinema salifodinae TaxID=1202768 RepID=A0A1I0PHW6_9EURY|nr:sulfatase-like hydrolase/transferase [Natrinema salifodinae]SEW13969.1 Sulfatase [Natrinema salifodinae]
MDLGPEKYNISTFIEACRNPEKFKYEIKERYGDVTKHVFYRKYGRPTNIMEADWDNLLILDACRFDYFSEYNSIEGDLNAAVSVASTSNEFMQKTFANGTFHDTVYVSANGFSHHLADDTFHEFVSTYPESQRDVLDSELYRNYHPEVVCDEAIDAHERNQDKRLLVHFMQPHGPYFGPKAEALRERLRANHGIEFSAWASDTDVTSRSSGMVYLLDAAERGYVSSDEIREVYVENLELVLDYVRRFLERVDGKTVVTADHGELLGEATNLYTRLTGNRYEHPGYVWVPELRIVPWLVVESGERRETVSERPAETDAVHEDVVEEHLQALGYTS